MPKGSQNGTKNGANNSSKTNAKTGNEKDQEIINNHVSLNSKIIEFSL